MEKNILSNVSIPPASFTDWMLQLHENSLAGFHRTAIVLAGDQDWVIKQVSTAVECLSSPSVLWVSSQLPDALPPAKARTQLGKEYDVIVFDAVDQLHVNALGAISGTLRGGGLLFLLIPRQDDWEILNTSRFHRRALALMRSRPGVFFLQQDQILPAIPEACSHDIKDVKIEQPFCTSDQQQVVNAIEAAVLERQAQPIVLVSDRGRGKSSGLGLAAGRLMQQGIKNIIVTAPGLSTSDPVFQHAQRVCANASLSHGHLISGQSSLQFKAPDALLLERPSADLLLVDEASAIPVQLLEQFLQFYPMVVFASTVHGYEGTGRGFALKFSKILDANRPGWQLFKMERPVRWAQGDPVEAWMDKLLCLDTELQNAPDIDAIDRDKCSVQLIDRGQLLKNDSQLSALFALLVNAHYRTQPSDLQHLMDDPDVRVYTLKYQDYILGAILINEEGGFDKDLSEKIYKGERRPAGNLLAQTLTFHAGCKAAATQKYARIMRIAIHPELQGNGLGSQLLHDVIRRERQYVSSVGASFGATVDLVRFWQTAGFELVRMGFTRDHASGTHSAVMHKPLNEQGEIIHKEVRGRFRRYLAAWMTGPLNDLSPEMKLHLQKEQQTDEKMLTTDDWNEIESFTYSYRSYEAVMWPIIKLVQLHAANMDNLPLKDRQVIQARIMEQNSWADTVRLINASGKAEALQCLRQSIKLLLIEIKANSGG